MDHANQIKQTIRDIVQKPIQHLYLAEVIDVQTDTCTVRIDSLTLSDVLLRPVIDTFHISLARIYKPYTEPYIKHHMRFTLMEASLSSYSPLGS